MKWTWHETQLPFHIILISKYNSYLQTIEYIYNEKENDVKYTKTITKTLFLGRSVSLHTGSAALG